MQLCALGVEDDYRNIESGDVLLEAEVAITGKEDIEFCRYLFQQFTIGNSTPSHFLHRDAVVTCELPAQSPVETFVNQNSHRSNGFEHLELACFNNSDGLCAFHGGKCFEEVFDRFITFQIVNEVL